MTMKASDNLRKLHEITEGVHAEAYICPAGVLTIGIGHTEQVKHPFAKDSKWTPEEISAAWRDDVAWAVEEANRRLTREVTQGIFDAVTDLIFNCGTGCRTFLTHVNNGNKEQAEDSLLKWINVGGKASLGLIKRRFADLALMRGDPDWARFVTCAASSKNYKALKDLVAEMGWVLEPDPQKIFALKRRGE